MYHTQVLLDSMLVTTSELGGGGATTSSSIGSMISPLLGIYSLTYVLTYLLTHSLIHLCTHSLTHSLTHSTTYSLTHVRTYFLGIRMLYPLLVTDRGRQVATLRVIISLLQYQVLALQAYGYIQTNNSAVGTITNNNIGGSAYVGGGSFVIEKNTNLAMVTTSTYTQAKVCYTLTLTHSLTGLLTHLFTY